MSGSKARVGFVNTHPIQYFAPFYRRINRSPDIEAVPIYLTDFSLRGEVDRQFGVAVTWDVDLLEGTNPLWVRGYKERELAPGVFRMLAPDIWTIVRRERFDALVIHGHNLGANHVATLAAKSVGTPVLYRGETHLLLSRWRSRSPVRRAMMAAYYRTLAGFLAIGSRNRDYYCWAGVAEDRIFDFPYTVDNDRLIAAAELTSEQKAAERKRLGLRDGVPVVVYASKLMQRKHPDHLLEAAIGLRSEGLDFDLLFVGTGEMQEELRKRAAALSGPGAVFAGFVNQSAMPRVLASSDLFVLPAEDEPWGLVINEAMCCGLPILASEEIGAVADLVRPGQNGFPFKAGDVRGLMSALRTLISDQTLRERMSAESRTIISGWNYDRCVEGLRHALRRVSA